MAVGRWLMAGSPQGYLVGLPGGVGRAQPLQGGLGVHVGVVAARALQLLALGPHAAGKFLPPRERLRQEGLLPGGVAHLRAFLAHPPSFAEAARHVAHARATLAELTGDEGSFSPLGEDDD